MVYIMFPHIHGQSRDQQCEECIILLQEGEIIIWEE